MKRICATLALVATLGLLVAAAPAEAGGGCHDKGMSDEAGTAVDMKNSCFYPTVLRVQAGDSVTFTNVDPDAHTVTGVANTWGEYEELGNGDSVTYGFDSSGVYPYFCQLHPGMVGAVVVGDGSATADQGTSSAGKVASRVAPAGANAAGEGASAADTGDGGGVDSYMLLVVVAAAAAATGLAAALLVWRRVVAP